MTEPYQRFDERQLMIRSHVFATMWLITIALLFLSAFVEATFEIDWAPHWQTYILIAALPSTFGGITLLVKGAHFEKRGMIGWGTPYLITALALLVTIAGIIGFASGNPFLSNGALTEDAGLLIIGLLFLPYGTVGIIKSRQLRDTTNR